MGTGRRYRPWIWRRLLVLALLSSLLPLCLLALLLLAVPFSGAGGEARIRVQVAQETEDQLARTTRAHAERIGLRLRNIGYGVALLATYAEDVLNAPQVFAAELAPQLTAEETGTAEAGDDAQDATPPPLGNPLFYTQGEDGAIRKLVDDGRSAVYFAARTGGEFSLFDLQRLHASTVIDPLLIEPTRADPLCSQTFMITPANLVRTYPFFDFSQWPADVDLAKPRGFWSPGKANEQGLVWSSPYISAFSGRWVVACLAAAQAGERISAVVGCEIDLANLRNELLSFSLGTGGVSWLIKQQASSETAEERWVVLSAQAGVREQLGIIPLDAANPPTETQSGEDVIAEADLLARGREDLVAALRRQLGTPNNGKGQPSVTMDPSGRYVVAAPIPEVGWLLGGVVQSPAVTVVGQFEQQLQDWQRRQLGVVVIVIAVALALAFILAWFEARRVTTPLGILTEQIRKAAASRRATSAAITDEGEIGALASAVQELIDAAVEQTPPTASEERDQDPTELPPSPG